MKNSISAERRLEVPVARGRVSINLPYERAEQLRKLANRHGVGVTALIERWIVRELEELGEKSQPPAGYFTELLAIGKERAILLQASGLPVTALTPNEARALCEALFNAADQNKATVLPRTERGNRHIEIRRQGRGVVLSIDGHRRSMTPLIATDLGTFLNFEADEAEELDDGEQLPKKAPGGERSLEIWIALQKGPRG
jgi:hypothetical protein